MQELKTGALIAAATEAGALLAGAESRHITALREFGELLGRAFQIRDDLIDLEGDESTTGKKTGKDRASGKATLPNAIGMEESRFRAGRLVSDARARLEEYGPEAEPLRAIAKYIIERRR